MSTASLTRCAGCGDPCRIGWVFCLSCHAWNDLSIALRYSALGIDEHRLHRALAHFAGHRHVEPLESLLRKLLQRVAELEYDAVAGQQ
jgi:hypothetical protein